LNLTTFRSISSVGSSISVSVTAHGPVIDGARVVVMSPAHCRAPPP